MLCQFQGDWFVAHTQKRAHGIIHFVMSGQGWLQIGRQTPKIIQQGDLIVFPHSADHILSSQADCQNSHHSILHTEQNGTIIVKSTDSGSHDLQLFCANFAYEPHADLFRNLPEVLHFNGKDSEFSHILALLQHEAKQSHPASTHLLNALVQVLLIHILRRYIDNPCHLSGVLNGLQDKRLRGVIAAVLETPSDDWTVEQMSAQAHLSRAQLMRLFKQHIGVSPHAFVNHIRLQEAAQLLRQTADSVLQIALSVGFQSETHFGKAFKKQYGMPPGVYRKSAMRGE